MLLFTCNTPVGHAPFCKYVKLTRGTMTQLFIECKVINIRLLYMGINPERPARGKEEGP